MSDLTDFLEKSLLDHANVNAAYAQPAGLFLALSTGSTTDAGAIVEPAVGGYARESITMSSATLGTGIATNTNTVSFTATGAAFGTIIAVAIFDAISGGNMLWHSNAFTDVAVNDGDTLEFAVGDVTTALA